MSEAIARPARGYSWQPFAVANTAGERHGAWSDRRIAPLVDELLAGLEVEVAADPQLEHLALAVFRPALRAWARCEARIELLSAYLEDRADESTPGDVDAEGGIRPAAELLTRLEGQALKHRAQLGLDPASFARLRRDAGSARVSFDLASLLAGLDQSALPEEEERDRDRYPSEEEGEGDERV